ncbi:MAG: hypothetical protein JJ896_10625 [Rhodothermales bacterium]|nr:hypothetical protein [Rhodothermales bacterium]MBO6780095.1 hypothetical protein [Rhodothermales bacterium]
MARVFAALLLVLLVVPSVQAQYSLSVQWFEREGDAQSSVSEEVAEAVRDQLTLRGWLGEGEAGRLYLRAERHDLPGGPVVVISIVEAAAMGDRIIDAAAEAQVFYAGQPLPEDTPEATMVREYMTREMMKGHVSVSHIEQIVTTPEEMVASVAAYLDDLDRRSRCMRNPAECA